MNVGYDLLLSIIIYALLSLVYTKGLKNSLLDGYRQDLFSLRDDLFALYFIDEIRTIKEPEYRYLELYINANIRFAHRISLISLIYLSKKIKSENIEHKSNLDKVKNTEYEEITKRLEIITKKYILISSPFLSLVLISVALVQNHFRKFDYKLILNKYYNPNISLLDLDMDMA